MEIPGGEVEVGDVLSGNLHALGGEELVNETQSVRLFVFIQDYACSHARAWAMVFPEKPLQ